LGSLQRQAAQASDPHRALSPTQRDRTSQSNRPFHHVNGIPVLLGLPNTNRIPCLREQPKNLLGEGSGSFLKKRTKKLLRVWAVPLRKGRSQNNQKFFASFFKKEALS
jgi:hypothetical protein